MTQQACPRHARLNRCSFAASVGVVISTAVSTAQGQCVPAFGPSAAYPAGGATNSIAVGDFNNDAKLDLVVSHGDFIGPGASVLLGVGDGTFQQPIGAVPLGSSLRTVVAQDFNSDGRLDIAISNYNAHIVHVLLGNGDGSFQTPSAYATGNNPQAMSTGDFNGDGRPDLVTVSESTASVYVLLCNANGTLQGAVQYPCGPQPRYVTVGDFNGDHRADVAVAVFGNSTVAVLLGNGNGTLQAASSIQMSSPASYIGCADFDRNGRLDLAVMLWSGTLSVMLGNGNGTFNPPMNYGTGFGNIGIADVDGDARLDIVLTEQRVVMRGSGSGGFETPMSLAMNGGQFVAFGDFDRDGRLDIAMDGGAANVLLQRTVAMPEITQQPIVQSVVSGQAVMFSVSATGPSELSYSWTRNGVELTDGGRITGSSTPTLTISPTVLGDNGAAIQCTVSSACSVVRSRAVGLAVKTNCPEDVIPDGTINTVDLVAFLARFGQVCQ